MKRNEIQKPGHVSKGNVLDDLGLTPQKSAVEKLKYEVHCKIMESIKKNKFTPAEVESLIQRPQPRVSELLTGKIAGMTLDRLVSYMEMLGGVMQMKIKTNKIA